jgi:hypothetical protein
LTVNVTVPSFTTAAEGELALTVALRLALADPYVTVTFDTVVVVLAFVTVSVPLVLVTV